MPRLCTICGHADRKKIEQAIAQGRALRGISHQYRVSPDALQRHKRHAKAAIEKAAAKRETSIGENVLARLERLCEKTEHILCQAESAGKLSLCLRAIAESRANLAGIFQLASKSAESGSLAGFTDDCLLEECGRRDLKMPVTLLVEYGDRQRQVESALEMQRRPELPAVPAEVIEKPQPEPAPDIHVEVLPPQPALPARPLCGLLSVEHRSVFGENFAKKVL